MASHKVFQLSGFSSRKKQELKECILSLKGEIMDAEAVNEKVTHIICGKPSRSEKFLGGLAMGKWILTVDFITDSFKSQKWQNESRYEWNTSKRKQAPNIENIDSLLAATTRWRKHIASSGTGPFLGWRAAVLVTNVQKQQTYQRLLKCGGASLINIKLPVKRPAQVGRSVSHVFVEETQTELVSSLLKHGVLCLFPVFIGIYLTTDPPPEPRDHLVTVQLACATNNLNVVPSQQTTQTATTKIPPNKPQSSAASKNNPTRLPSSVPPSKPQVSTASKTNPNTQGDERERASSPGDDDVIIVKVVTPVKKLFKSSSTSSGSPTGGKSTQTLLPLSWRQTKICKREPSCSPTTPSQLKTETTEDIDETASLSYISQDSTSSCPDTSIGVPACKGTRRFTLTIPERMALSGSVEDPNNERPSAVSTPLDSSELDLAQFLAPLTPVASISKPETNNNQNKDNTSFNVPSTQTLPPKREDLVEKHGAETLTEDSKGTKRKLDLPGSMAKRQKLDLPWVRACPDIAYRNPATMTDMVVLQVSASMTYMFEAALEENHISQALYMMQSSVTTRRYAQPKALHKILQILLEAEDDSRAFRTYKVARRVVSLHPPTSSVSQELYLSAIRGDVEDREQPTAGRGWELLENSFRILLDEERSSEHVQHFLYLKFVVAVVETNMSAIMNRFDQRSKSLQVTTSLWAQLMWARGKVGQINWAVTSLLSLFLESLSAKHTHKYDPSAMLQSLLSATAHCCYQKSTQVSVINRNAITLARELAFLTKGDGSNDGAYTHRVLAAIDLPWLRLNIVLTLFETYDDSLLEDLLTEHLVSQNLNLKTIVGRYFFMLPPLLPPEVPASPHPKLQKAPSTPTKTAPRSKRKSHTKEKIDSVQSTPEKSTAATPRMIKNVNKKDIKGETALHKACRNNNVRKVKELLQIQGIDVNAPDHGGWTPLHEACNHGSLECVAELLKYKPTKTITSFFSTDQEKNKKQKLDLKPQSYQEGVTPLHDAAINHHLEVARLLLQHGGKDLLDIEARDGNKPLDVARSDVMRDILTSAEYMVPTSPCVTPRKRKAYIPGSEDSYPSSQGSLCAVDSSALSISPPSEDRYRQVLSANTAPVSNSSCLNLCILLRHLIQSYMLIHETILIKQQSLTLPPHPCPYTDPGQCRQGKSHMRCLSTLQAERLGLGEEHLLEDLGMLRTWPAQVHMLKTHLERIAQRNLDEKVQVQLSLIEMLGSLT